MAAAEKPDWYADLRPVVEPSERWVRVRLGGEFVADCKRPLLLIDYGPGRLPSYFFPRGCVHMDLLEAAGDRDGRQFWTVRVGDTVARQAAWAYTSPPAGLEALRGHLTFKWHKMDAWYEEEEQVFVHARDPHKRVDVMPSSRHVKVVVAGETVAETRRPHLLFETGLPTRYYFPMEDVRMELLQPTEMVTRCPYKGQARYWSVAAGGQLVENLAWSYPDPILECPKIKGLVSFFNERVDLYVDGELQLRPITPWSER